MSEVGPATAGVLADVHAERIRQEMIGQTKRSLGIDWRSCADPAMAGGDGTRYAVLGEEVGEVANAMLEAGYALPSPTSTAFQIMEVEEYQAIRRAGEAHLRAELVQVAAVAVAWAEAIDARAEP